MSAPALPSPPRKTWLDAIKGVAILLVVLTHTYGIPYLNGYLNACYMPLFFIASGYVFNEKQGIYRRKLGQLLLPYAKWAILYLLVACMAASNLDWVKLGTWVIGIGYSRFRLFADPETSPLKLLPPGAAPLWFLTGMAASYILVRPLIRAAGAKGIFLIISYLGISAAFMFCPILMPWSLDTAFMGALFIYTGYKLKNISLNSRHIWLTLLVSLPIYLVLTHFNTGINMSIREYGNMGITSLLLFGIIGILGTISYACFFMLTNETWLCRAFAYFGRISLTIMCSHMLFVRIFNKAYTHLISQGINIPKIVMIPVRLVLVLLLCIATHQVLNYCKKRMTTT